MRNYGQDIKLCLNLSREVKGTSEEYKRFAGKYELPDGILNRYRLVPLKQRWIFAGVSLSISTGIIILLTIIF